MRLGDDIDISEESAPIYSEYDLLKSSISGWDYSLFALRELKISLWREFGDKFTAPEKVSIKSEIDWQLNKANQRRNILWIIWKIM